MFLRLLKINIFLLLFSCITFAEVISKINISGNVRLTNETIKVLGGFKIDDDLNNNDLNKITKNLYGSDFFKDVNISLKDNVLNINVLENPIIQSIFIEGIKKKNITEKLLEILSVKEKSSYVPYKVDIDKDKILNILKSAGYYFVEIDMNLITNTNNTVDIIYNIELGDKANIKKIKFTGNKKFKDRKLKNIITSEENKIWKIISRNKYLDRQKIELDKRLLNSFYKNNGYYNVKINSLTVEFLDSNNFELNFNIDAGEKFFFNNFNLILPKNFDKVYFNSVQKVFTKLKNKPYSLQRIEKILDELDKIALSKQYEFISAEVEEKIINKNRLNFNFFLKETEKFYVDKINIYGNTITEENFIRNQFYVDEGDAFNEILHNKTINKIKSTNVFKTVVTEVVESDTLNKKIINITVEEKPTGEISAGAGVGTSGGSVAFSIKENNFLGRGTRLNSSIAIEDKAIKGVISATIPNYNYSDNSLTLSAQSSTEDNLRDFGYKTAKNGFSVGTNFEQYEDFYFSPSVSAMNEKLTTNTGASKNLKKQEGTYTDLFFNYALIYDKRDRGYQPTEGFKSTFSQELPLYSDTYSFVNGYTFSSYHTMKEDMVGVFSIYTKMINSLASDKDVRVSERLQVPANRLRGFKKGKIGPIDDGYVGGNYVTALNLATNLPALLPALQMLDFKVFFDAANVWGVDYSKEINNSNTIRSAAGVAVDWFTPIGPLSFSLSKAITSNKTDKLETFRFNLGTTF